MRSNISYYSAAGKLSRGKVFYCVCMAIALVQCIVWGSSLEAQIPSILEDVPGSAHNETWFGWIDTPNQQIRTLLRLQRNANGKVDTATLSTDLVPTPVPLTELQLTDGGEWKFKFPKAGPDSFGLSFQGLQATPEMVSGALEQSNQKIPLDLRKLPSDPVDSKMQLGANLVWYGTSTDEIKPQEYRIRVYNAPPFVTSGAPRIVFDSLTKGLIGVPAKFTESGDRATFEIATPGTRSRYIAKLTPEGNELIGTLNEGNELIGLSLKLWSESSSDEKKTSPESLVPNPTLTNTESSNVLSRDGNPESKTKKKETDGNETKEVDRTSPSFQTPTDRKDPPKVETNSNPPTTSNFLLASSEFFVEREFEVKHGGSTVKTKSYPNGKPGITIRGIMTLPRTRSASQRFPAVVMLSGNGPQDQDSTVGRHKPFAVLAHFLAENGMASFRFEDRGISDGTDFFAFTSEDFCRDAIAVWRFAKSHESIDSQRLGLLGHSEGAAIGMMAATWEPSINFLVLLSPAGLNGSDISRLQIDKYSELQGMNEEDRTTTNLLQMELQMLATNYAANEDAFPSLIRESVNKHWEGLKKIALAQDPNSNLNLVKQQLVSQIEAKFVQLRLPWYRYYLAYDPITTWMLVRCPTLALWGEKDSQIIAELNRQRIATTIRRNASIEASLEILPGLNHLLQKCTSGLPEEYDHLDESISSEALSRILQWAESLGIIDGVTKR